MSFYMKYDKMFLGGNMFVKLGEEEFKVNIIRKNNKHIYFRFDDQLNLCITCGFLVTERQLSKLIKDNEDGLYKMYQKVVKKKEKETAFHYLGRKYTIIFNDEYKTPELSDEFILVKNEKMLEKFLTNECKKVFEERIETLLPLFHGIPKFKLRIRSMKTRWGVCNRKDNIVTLNSELIKKSIPLIDYVIVHELSHFYQANHSSLFWKEVEKRYPNYKQARKLLKEV